MSTIQFRLSTNDYGNQTLVAFVNGILTDPIDDTHPNFTAIVGACQSALLGDPIDTEGFVELFDITKAVESKFQKLGERVSVKGNQILFDGDPVTGPLEDQILDFLNRGEDFAPLIKLYEKLTTNPLGNVREGLFSWIAGQKVLGNFTIDQDGDILGYKSVNPRSPKWRTGYTTVYVPSQPSRKADIVNGEEVKPGNFIEQVPGDVVEMPRSVVLNEPSAQCGEGLHIGTWEYAESFYGGSVVLLVKFSPRDIVSLPDSNSSWKLRVNRYTVVDVVSGPLEDVFFRTSSDEDDVYDDVYGDDDGDDVYDDVYGDDDEYDSVPVGGAVKHGDLITSWRTGNEYHIDGNQDGPDAYGTYNTEEHRIHMDNVGSIERKRTYSGPTSYAAKGNGRNPAQDAAGKFTNGRPGSARDAGTGRFV